MIWLRLLPYAIAALAGIGAIYGIHHAGYNQCVIEAQLAQAESDRAAAAKLRKLEGTKNENMAEINRLRANNHALWLRLPRTVSGCPGEDTTSGSGQLPASAPSSEEKALNEFADQCGDQAYQCDAIVESCRVLTDALE